jgi:hypothetical protein
LVNTISPLVDPMSTPQIYAPVLLTPGVNESLLACAPVPCAYSLLEVARVHEVKRVIPRVRPSSCVAMVGVGVGVSVGNVICACE